MFEDPYQRSKDYILALMQRSVEPRLSAKALDLLLEAINWRRQLIDQADQAEAAGLILAHEYADERQPEAVWPITGHLHYAFVTPSSRHPGMFRWTWFDAQGWGGHYDQFMSPKDAFYDMLEAGYRVPAFGALQTAMAGKQWPPQWPMVQNPAATLVDRGRTAISRGDLSRPLRLAGEAGLLRHNWSIFDYGCGRGDDVRMLKAMGFRVAGWDPKYSPKSKKKPSDIVNLGYVINVIEDRKERDRALRAAWRLAKRVLIVSARLASENGAGMRKYKDGVLTSIGTFQKYYTQRGLQQYIEKTLGAQAQPAAPGVFLVYKGKQFMRNPGITTRNKKRVNDAFEKMECIRKTMEWATANRWWMPNEKYMWLDALRAAFEQVKDFLEGKTKYLPASAEDILYSWHNKLPKRPEELFLKSPFYDLYLPPHWVNKKGKRVISRPLALSLVDQIRLYTIGGTNFQVAGSIRRMEPFVADIDIVFSVALQYRAPMIRSIIDTFPRFHGAGKKKVSFNVGDVPVQIFMATQDTIGAQLLESTGPAGYNIGLRMVAKRQGKKLNDKGVFNRETGKLIPRSGESERQMYAAIGKEWKEPELRGK